MTEKFSNAKLHCTTQYHQFSVKVDIVTDKSSKGFLLNYQILADFYPKFFYLSKFDSSFFQISQKFGVYQAIEQIWPNLSRSFWTFFSERCPTVLVVKLFNR